MTNEFIKECNNITDEIRNKTNTIKTSDITYLLTMYKLNESNKLKHELVNNSEKYQKFVRDLSNRIFKQYNSMTYAVLTRYFLLQCKQKYKMYVGFSCASEDKALYRSMQPDLSNHPFPANHIYFMVDNGDIIECFNNKTNKYVYKNIEHIDCVITEEK